MNSSASNAEALITKLLTDIYHDPKIQVSVGDHRRLKFNNKIFSRFSLRNPLRSFTFTRKPLQTYVVLDGKLLIKNSVCRNNLIDIDMNYNQIITEHYALEKDEILFDVSKTVFPNISSPDSSSKSQISACSSSDTCTFDQWKESMKIVVKLPSDIPLDARRKLWLKLADNYLRKKHVDWPTLKNACFNEWSNKDDVELDAQILKDLHRTGCELFCGREGYRNQILLKRVLLAYARWNKKIGYCQGFNMLAAFILQVMNGDEFDSLKIMIYLIESVLPQYYFGSKLHGLSVDMIVFQDLLQKYLPKLSKHLYQIQKNAPSYEPPLVNLFTMQWFLTLYCNYLPQKTVLRIWDLIFLYGNDIVLKTALIIWENLERKILTLKTADEFYSIMSVVTREMCEFGFLPEQDLVHVITNIDDNIQKDIIEFRQHHLFNIKPWYLLRNNKESSRSQKGQSYYQSDREKVALDIKSLRKNYKQFVENQKKSQFVIENRQKRSISIDQLLISKKAVISTNAETLNWSKNMKKYREPQQSDSESSPSTELCDSDDSEDNF